MSNLLKQVAGPQGQSTPTSRQCLLCGVTKGSPGKLCRVCFLSYRRPPDDPAVYMVDEIARRRFPLIDSLYAIVNVDTYDSLLLWKWGLAPGRQPDSYYANGRQLRRDGTYLRLSMARIIFGDPGEGKIVDHRDGRILNNVRENLRPATHRENQGNRRMNRNNSSGHIGVSWDKATGLWIALLKDTVGECWNLGRYADKEEAAMVRDAKAIEVFGEFAVLNFPHTHAVTEMSFLYPYLIGQKEDHGELAPFRS